MFYDCKEIKFPNGTTQLQLYSQHIYRNEEDEKEEKEEDKKEKAQDEEKEKSTKEDRELRSEYSSYTRTVRNLYDYTRCAKWEYFLTLTLDPDKVDRFDYPLVTKKLRKWFNHIKDRYAPKLMYVVVPEKHKDGAWHFHAIVANTGKLEFVDSKRRKKGEVIYNLKQYSLGFSTATKVKDTYRVSSYITKYITKDICRDLPGRQRYFASQNIPKPTSTFYQLNYGRQGEYNPFTETFEKVDEETGEVFEVDENYTTVRDFVCKYFVEYADRITHIKQVNNEFVKQIYYIEILPEKEIEE